MVQEFTLPVVSLQLVGIVLVLMFLYFVIRTYLHWPRSWKNNRDGDFVASFLRCLDAEKRWNMRQKAIMKKVIKAWSENTCGGVILVEIPQEPVVGEKKDQPEKQQQQQQQQQQPIQMHQMIEIVQPLKFRQMPMFEIHWAYAGSLVKSKIFLKNQKVELIECDSDSFRCLFSHLASYCNWSDNRIDTDAGCKVYEGFLSPVV